MLEKIFDSTVDVLESISDKTGIGYKKINALGMIIWVGITTALTIIVLKKKKK